MSLALFVAIFFLIWWIVFFTVLPWGVRGQHEGTVEPGTEPGAPQKPLLPIKLAVTTLIAGAIMAVFYFVWTSGLVSLERLPMPFDLPNR